MQAARDGTKLVERDRDLAPRLVEPRARVAVAGHLLFQQAQLERERDQPLLGSIMQIALQPLALTQPRLDHPCTRTLQLLQVSFLLGLQAAVLERDSGRGADRGEQLTFFLQRRVMEQRGHPRPFAVDQRHCSAARRFRQHHAPPIQIGPTPKLRQPVRELE